MNDQELLETIKEYKIASEEYNKAWKRLYELKQKLGIA